MVGYDVVSRIVVCCLVEVGLFGFRVAWLGLWFAVISGGFWFPFSLRVSGSADFASKVVSGLLLHLNFGVFGCLFVFG